MKELAKFLISLAVVGLIFALFCSAALPTTSQPSLDRFKQSCPRVSYDELMAHFDDYKTTIIKMDGHVESCTPYGNAHMSVIDVTGKDFHTMKAGALAIGVPAPAEGYMAATGLQVPPEPRYVMYLGGMQILNCDVTIYGYPLEVIEGYPVIEEVYTEYHMG